MKRAMGAMAGAWYFPGGSLEAREVPAGTEPRVNEEHSAARWIAPGYLRERFLNDGVLTAIAKNPVALESVSRVRGVIDAYLAR